MEYVTLVAGILEDLLGVAESATTGQASSIISMIERFIQAGAALVPSLITPLQNIINQLNGNPALTADQVATLQAQSAALDAALDAAAKDDNLSGS